MEDDGNNVNGRRNDNDSAVDNAPPNEEEEEEDQGSDGSDGSESEFSAGEEDGEDARLRRRLRRERRLQCAKKLFARVRRNVPTLDRLHLSNKEQFDYIADNWEDVVEAAKTNVTVKTVHVDIPFEFCVRNTTGSRESYWERICSPVARALGKLKSLELFQFVVVVLAEYFALAPFLRELRQISTCSIEVQTPSAPPTVLLDSALRGHPKLQKLEFTITSAEEFDDENPFQFPFSTNLQTLPKIREILIRCPEEAYPDISNLDAALQPTRLELISVSGLRLNGEANLAIGNLIQRNSPNLTTLKFPRCRTAVLNSARIIEQLNSNTNLKGFNFACPNDIGVYHQLGMCLQENKHLQMLGVCASDESPTHQVGLLYLLNALAMSQTNIQCFRVCGYGWDEMLCYALGIYLRVSRTLQAISITGRPLSIQGLNDTFWKRVARSIACSNLTFMEVEGDMTSNGLREGLQFFQGNSAMTGMHIYVKDHILSETLVGCVADLCCMNSKIEDLELGEESHFRGDEVCLSIEQAETILRHLKQNYSLSSCPFRITYPRELEENADHISSDIESILMLNKAGRCYILDKRASKECAVGVLSEVSDDLDCIYVHVRENPEMCLREGRSNNSVAMGRRRKRRRTRQQADVEGL